VREQQTAGSRGWGCRWRAQDQEQEPEEGQNTTAVAAWFAFYEKLICPLYRNNIPLDPGKFPSTVLATGAYD